MDTDALQALSRAELQKIAKANEIKANSKSIVIIRQLLELFPDGVPIENKDTPTQPGPTRTTRSRRRHTPVPSTQRLTSRTTRSKRPPPSRHTPASPCQTASGDIAGPLSLCAAASQQPENNHGANPTTPLLRLGGMDADASASPPPSTRSLVMPSTQPGPSRTTRSKRRYTPVPSTTQPTSRTTRSKRPPPPRHTPPLPPQTASGDIAGPSSLGAAAPQQPENNHGANPATPLLCFGRRDVDAFASPPPSTRALVMPPRTHRPKDRILAQSPAPSPASLGRSRPSPGPSQPVADVSLDPVQATPLISAYRAANGRPAPREHQMSSVEVSGEPISVQLRLARDRHQSPSDEMPNEQARGSDAQGSRREKQVLPEMQLDEPPRDQPAPPPEDPFGIDDMEIPGLNAAERLENGANLEGSLTQDGALTLGSHDLRGLPSVHGSVPASQGATHESRPSLPRPQSRPEARRHPPTQRPAPEMPSEQQPQQRDIDTRVPPLAAGGDDPDVDSAEDDSMVKKVENLLQYMNKIADDDEKAVNPVLAELPQIATQMHAHLKKLNDQLRASRADRERLEALLEGRSTGALPTTRKKNWYTQVWRRHINTLPEGVYCSKEEGEKLVLVVLHEDEEPLCDDIVCGGDDERPSHEMEAERCERIEQGEPDIYPEWPINEAIRKEVKAYLLEQSTRAGPPGAGSSHHLPVSSLPDPLQPPQAGPSGLPPLLAPPVPGPSRLTPARPSRQRPPVAHSNPPQPSQGRRSEYPPNPHQPQSLRRRQQPPARTPPHPSQPSQSIHSKRSHSSAFSDDENFDYDESDYEPSDYDVAPRPGRTELNHTSRRSSKRPRTSYQTPSRSSPKASGSGSLQYSSGSSEAEQSQVYEMLSHPGHMSGESDEHEGDALDLDGGDPEVR